MGVEQKVTINAAPDRVFGYVADLERHGEWSNPKHKLEIKKTSEGPAGQGSVFKSVGHQFGRNEDTLTVTEYAPDQRIAFESSGNAGVIRHTFEVAPSDGGTQLTKRFEPVSTKFPFSILAPLVSMFVLPGALKSDLERIKERIEGASG